MTEGVGLIDTLPMSGKSPIQSMHKRNWSQCFKLLVKLEKQYGGIDNIPSTDPEWKIVCQTYRQMEDE